MDFDVTNAKFVKKNCISEVKILKIFACGAILPHYISPIGPNNYVLVAVLYEVKNLYKFYRRFVIDSNIVSKKSLYRLVVGIL